MPIVRMCSCEYISNIFVSVYMGVVDYLFSIQISTVVLANIDVLSKSFDDSHGD